MKLSEPTILAFPGIHIDGTEMKPLEALWNLGERPLWAGWEGK
jgi:hypothetical protein